MLALVRVTVGAEIPLLNALCNWFTTLSFNASLSVFLGCILLANVAIGCVYFFVSEVILRKRLNLD